MPNDRGKSSGTDIVGGMSRRRFLETTAMAGAAGGMLMLLPSSPRAQATGEPLRLGVMGPFTGPASRTGDGFRDGAILALEEARVAGEVPVTVNGGQRDIELVFVDSESNPERAVRAVTDAVERRGVQMMVAGWHSSVAMAVMDATAALGVVHIGHNGESQYISEKINDDPEKYRGWFKGWPSPPIFAGLYGPPLMHFMEQGLWKPANRRAAILVEDTDFGRGWGDALLDSLQQAGFEPLPYDVTGLDETEFTPLLTKYRAQRVSVVAMTTTGSISASNFVRQFRQQRLPALLLGHGLTWFSEWYELTGEASDFVVTMDSPRVIAPYQQDWVERYTKRFGEEPSFAPAGHSYDYMRIAIDVLNRAGSLDRERLIETALATDQQGIWHRYRFAREASERAMAPNEVEIGGFEDGFFFPMVQMKGGKPEIVWPLEHAQKTFEAPPWV